MLNCVKYIVIIYNLLFWLIGVGILGFSVYLYVDTQSYVNVDSAAELINTPFFVIMALGAIMTLVGFLGCCGAIRESSCLLGMYIFFCVTMGVACGAAVWWSRENESLVRNKIERDFTSLIKQKYTKGARGGLELLVDQVQHDFQCCGVNDYKDWKASKYQQGNYSNVNVGVSNGKKEFEVPESCCIRDYRTCNQVRKIAAVDQSEGLNTQGCIRKVGDFVEKKWHLLIIIGLVLVLVQIFALLFTCCFCCALSRGYK